MKKTNKLLSFLSLLLTCTSSVCTAQVFVLGDAFPSNGLGNINLPANGTNGTAGNSVDSVYLVSNGNGGNPFNGGNSGGNFSPITVGTFGADDYRATINFDLSSLDLSAISSPPPAFEYQITSIELFLELGSPDDITGGSVDVDVFTNTGITTGVINQTPDATFTVLDTAPAGDFLAPIFLSTDSISLGNQNNFEVTLDVAQDGNAIRLGSGLSTAADPNFGINGTNFVEVGPRLRITTELVAIPEPSTFALLSIFSLCVISRRNRK